MIVPYLLLQQAAAVAKKDVQTFSLNNLIEIEILWMKKNERKKNEPKKLYKKEIYWPNQTQLFPI